MSDVINCVYMLHYRKAEIGDAVMGTAPDSESGDLIISCIKLGLVVADGDGLALMKLSGCEKV